MSKLDLNSYLSHVFFFEGLTPAEIGKIAENSTIKCLKKNTNLFEQGDDASAFFVVVSGKLSVYRLSAKGDEQVVHMHNDGDVIAEAAIFGKKKYPASCRVLKESTVVRIPKDDFINLILDNPKISLKIMASYSKRLREFISMVEYLTLDDIRARLLKYLDKHKVVENGQTTVSLTISKKELAHLLGTVPETLSRNIKLLKQEGIITEKSGTFILKS